MKKYVCKEKPGFTLIELLVVISIIGFLASASVLAFNSARIKSRDAKRKADLVQVRKALILYADNHGGVLPVTGFGSGGGGNGWATNSNNGSICYTGFGDLEDFLDGTDPDIPTPVIKYVKMGHDPKCGGCSGCDASQGGYMYYHTASCGTLFAHLENSSAQDLVSCTGACTGLPGYGMNYCVDVRP